jgi:hypothetical protein
VAGIQRYFRDELKKSKKDNAFGADYWSVDKWCLKRYETEKQGFFTCFGSMKRGYPQNGTKNI